MLPIGNILKLQQEDVNRIEIASKICVVRTVEIDINFNDILESIELLINYTIKKRKVKVNYHNSNPINKIKKYSNIWDMFLKRKIISALDKYEDMTPKNRLTSAVKGASTRRQEGITQGAFISWFRDQGKNHKFGYEQVDKCINDCIEDGYINRVYVQGDEIIPYLSSYSFEKPEKKYYQVENISVASRGRYIIKWYNFYLKYLPEQFEDVKIVIFTVIGTLTFSHFIQFTSIINEIINALARMY